MNVTKPALFLAVIVLAGCLGAQDGSNPPPPPVKPAKAEAVEITPANTQFDQRRSAARAAGVSRDKKVLTEGDIVTLPKFVVTAEGFVNFGFSVITNREVRQGGMVKWMRVGVGIPGSIAAESGLFTGDQVYAIDGVPVTELTRDAMLSALFQRNMGDHPRLAVLARRHGYLPIWVILGEARQSPR